MASLQPVLALGRRYPLATICGGLAVIIAAVFAFRYSVLDEQQQARDAVRKERDTLKRYEINAGPLEGQLKQLKDAMSKLDTRLVKESELATNLQHFYRLQTVTGLTPVVQQSQSSRRGPAKSGLFPVAFSLSVDAPFAPVLGLVSALEHGPVEYRVVSFSCIRSSGGRDSNSTDGPVAGERVALSMQLELLGTP